MWSFEQDLFVSEGSTGLESKVESSMENVAFSESHAHCLVFPEISDADFDLSVSTKSSKTRISHRN